MLPAKIIAVADTVEAMSNFRPFRPAQGVDKALEEVKSQVGTLYDASVVAACVRLFSQGRFRFSSP
jgi:HD-GYP domain-containing protein (c-di-GMP phosphodiesterase class II)